MPYAADRNQEEIAFEIDNFNQAIYEICVNYNIRFVDITPLSRQVSKHPEWIASDGLHPSGIQYSKWVEELLPLLKPINKMDLNLAKELDQKDPLVQFRARFFNPKNELYFDGNSLGKLPLEAQKTLDQIIQKQWGERLIRSWNEQWLELPKRIASKYASLLGADPNEVCIGESTSVRLYQILHALLSSNLFPKHLTTDSLNFPTDLYIMDGLKKAFNIPSLNVVSYPSEINADLNSLKESIVQNPGIICLSLVSYKSAFLYPMQLLNRWAEKHHSVIVWDLSHAVGAGVYRFQENRN
jgi:kynureninase